MSKPTSKQIEDANAYWASREGLAASMARRATQLHKLIELKAPEIVIEGARQLMFKSLMTFPVNEQARLAHIEMKRLMEQDEFKALEAAGYFKEPE